MRVAWFLVLLSCSGCLLGVPLDSSNAGDDDDDNGTISTVSGLTNEPHDRSYRVFWDALSGVDGYAIFLDGATEPDDEVLDAQWEETDVPNGTDVSVEVAGFRGTGGNRSYGPKKLIDAGPLQPGELVPDFQAGGVFMIDWGNVPDNGDDYGNDLYIDDNGVITVVGAVRIENGGRTDLGLWRFDADGVLDQSLDVADITGGVQAVTNLKGFRRDIGANGNADSIGWGVVVDASGRTYVSGTAPGMNSSPDFGVWKYQISGARVPAFDNDGLLLVDGQSGTGEVDRGRGIAMDSSGKIVATGTLDQAAGGSPPDDNPFTARLSATDGSFDTSFNNPDGFVIDGNGVPEIPNDITLDGSDNVYLAGTQFPTIMVDSNAYVWKYGANGAGVVKRNLGESNDTEAEAIAFDSAANRVYVAGAVFTATDETSIRVWCRDQNLDQNCAQDVTTIQTPGVKDRAYAVAIQGSKVLVAGEVSGEAALIRLNPDLTLDTTFGTDHSGIQVFPDIGVAYGVAVAPDTDRIYLTGGATDPNDAPAGLNMVLWRVAP